MTQRIFRSILIVALAVLLLSLFLIVGILYDYFGSAQKARLAQELRLASGGVEAAGVDYLEALAPTQCRLTLVSPSGKVLFDTETDPSEMENHSQREEIMEAFENGHGESSRYSNTLLAQTFYSAVRLDSGEVLRISTSRMTVLALILGLLRPIIIILLAAFAMSLFFAARMSKRIVRPLNSLDLDKPLENDVYDELSPLLGRIEQQKRQIDRQRTKLEASKREFYAVIRNMNEGLLLIGAHSEIISINPAAESFFGTNGDAVGKDFILVERNPEIGEHLKEAISSGHSVLETERNGRVYQLNFSAIESGKGESGAVILVFDITDKVYAEQSRREFTANVSHELKTPLQTIMGSAELIENRLVREEDITGFAAKIRKEASRLVLLIDDIIRLSQLDEAGDMPLEKVSLKELAESQIDMLSPAADKRDVSLSLCIDGGDLEITAVRRLIQEIIYNLLDNAIKYNRPGGSVSLDIRSEGGEAVISVADTGIGIPAEHRERIFERFYRVDKSHSKETGGTGLGLSIVKHAVGYLKGRIELKSEIGAGTTVTIRLPLEV